MSKGVISYAILDMGGGDGYDIMKKILNIMFYYQLLYIMQI